MLINRIGLVSPSAWKSDTVSFQQQLELSIIKTNECIEAINTTIDFVNSLNLDTMVNLIKNTFDTKVTEVNNKIVEINQKIEDNTQNVNENIEANNTATATAIANIATALTQMQATLTAYVAGLVEAGKIEMLGEINTRLLQLENVANLPQEIVLLMEADILAAAAAVYDSGWIDGVNISAGCTLKHRRIDETVHIMYTAVINSTANGAMLGYIPATLKPPIFNTYSQFVCMNSGIVVGGVYEPLGIIINNFTTDINGELYYAIYAQSSNSAVVRNCTAYLSYIRGTV